MSKGRFGVHGGQYIPETLMHAVGEVEEAYLKYKDDPAFQQELQDLYSNDDVYNQYWFTCRPVQADNSALADMGRKIIRVKSGKIESVKINENPTDIDDIEY